MVDELVWLLTWHPSSASGERNTIT